MKHERWRFRRRDRRLAGSAVDRGGRGCSRARPGPARAHERFRRTGQSSRFTYEGREVSMAEAQELLGLTPVEARTGDVSRLATRGALLHTDVAVALDRSTRSRDRRRVPQPQRR